MTHGDIDHPHPDNTPGTRFTDKLIENYFLGIGGGRLTANTGLWALNLLRRRFTNSHDVKIVT